MTELTGHVTLLGEVYIGPIHFWQWLSVISWCSGWMQG